MEPSRNKTGHTRLVLIVVAFILGAGLGGLGVHFLALSVPESQPTRVVRPLKTDAKVTALGRIEPAAGVVTLGIPVPDRLRKIFPGVKEEAIVKAGDELVELESREARVLELQLSEEQLADALLKKEAIKTKGDAQIALDEFRLEQLDAVAPFDRKLQKQKIDVLAQQVENARRNLERSESLGNTVSKQETEQQKLLALQAEAEHKSAEIGLDKLKLSQVLDKKAAQTQLTASKAALSSALKEVPTNTLKSQRDLARVKLAAAIVRAPSKGTILRILARPGELVGAQQPILQMADTEQMIVIAEVYETDIRNLRLGNKAVITGRALPEQLKGEVIQIGAIIGKNRVVDADPTVEVDRRIVEVKIRLDQSAPAARLINHQVMVEIETAGKGKE